MDPERIVTDFCNAFARLDVEALTGFFAEDAVYHNIPIAAVTGKEAIAATLQQFLGPASDAEFEIRSMAASGQVVLTERIDRFTIGDKKIALPVMGVFEVGSDGKISAWRDYFDMAQFTGQMA